SEASGGPQGVVEHVQSERMRLALPVPRDAAAAAPDRALALSETAAAVAGRAQSGGGGAAARGGAAGPRPGVAGRRLFVRTALERTVGFAGARRRQRPHGLAHPRRQGEQGALRAAVAA